MGEKIPTEPCSCSEARAHLERFLDHECDRDLEARLAEHVASCEHCSRQADAERHLRELVRSRCAEQAPASLRARVLGQLSAARITTAGAAVTSVAVAAVAAESLERR
ncbi:MULTISPECIES: mycothiol system anti-sigma-R factor [unclassified Actinomyces]|uniref:mycothiol system anti-sigma-R factor n=1 Tax=unclassified Actinomyces TaxID=2609248 RepID=UPI0013742098|nr:MULTISPECIES: mycothiol system anti-sigma-R factor [unclassified Actinomyces]MBW3069878.1 mycothiol system anti-sigma-R factor [Actinomyces sp. 594]NDR53859.1 mycothiol system anti-sigma-R factor [Actinomyces sp. 565]QHO90690.1 mycothiol system anti-sigma-R factor [Actinomyces sp. 432]